MGCRAGCLRLATIVFYGLAAIVIVSVLAGYVAVALVPHEPSADYITSPLVGTTLDFWDAPGDECHGADVAYQELLAARNTGRKPDLSIIDRLPGHHTIMGGMRVRLLDVTSILCAGIREWFAHVQVSDRRSSLFSREGYLPEVRLTPVTR